MRMLIVALVIQAGNKCPLTGEQINKTGVMEYMECGRAGNESTYIHFSTVNCQTCGVKKQEQQTAINIYYLPHATI